MFPDYFRYFLHVFLFFQKKFATAIDKSYKIVYHIGNPKTQYAEISAGKEFL